MARWGQTTKAVQRAVPIGLLSVPAAQNAQTRRPEPKSAGSSLAFSQSEISSLQNEIHSTSASLTEEKRQLLDGLFDLVQDPILQNQVLMNPAFGRILSAATKIPLVTSSHERPTIAEPPLLPPASPPQSRTPQSSTTTLATSHGFPEIQGLVLDNSGSGGWSVVVRTPSQNSTTNSPSTSERISLSGLQLSDGGTPASSPESSETSPLTDEELPLILGEGSFANETLKRIWTYISSFWHWLLPESRFFFPSSTATGSPQSATSPSSSSSASSPHGAGSGWFYNSAGEETGNYQSHPHHNTVERVKMWSILGASMIILVLILRRVYLHFNVAEQHSRELGRLLIMATLDHVFAFDFKHV